MLRWRTYRWSFLLALLCGWGLSLPAQQDWTWTFGDSVLMRFPGGGAPVVDPDARTRYSLESSSCISDGNGNLRYYVSGGWLRHSDGSTLHNASPFAVDDLTNAYMLLPVWGDTNNYLLFTLSYNCGLPTHCPWLVEIKGGMGQDSVFDFRNLGQYHPTHSLSEKIAAVRDASGTGWWVLYHGGEDSAFVRFKVDGRQVSSLSTQYIGSKHTFTGTNPFFPIGEMCFSPQGDRLLAVTMTGVVDVFDFDRCTGQLSNWLALGTPAPNNIGPDTYYGCSFSEDGTKIYVSEGGNGLVGDRLYQWDLTSTNIPASKTLLFTSPDSVTLGQHQLGPDGKVYITQLYVNDAVREDARNLHLSVINNPNAAGLACNFVYRQVYLEGLHSTGNLPNLPNFNLPPLVAQVAEAGPPTVYICPGDSVQIGYPDSTGGAVTYAWQAHPDIADTSLPQVWVAPVVDTWYFLTAVDSAFGLPCGRTVDSIHVVIAGSGELPVASCESDTTICPGDTISVSVSASGVQGLLYAWSTGSDSASTVVSAAGVYSVTVTHPLAGAGLALGACFSASDSVRVDTFAVLPNPVPRDTVICRGDSIVLGMGLPPNWAGNWLPASGLVDPDSAFTVAFPPLTTTYSLFASDTTDPMGCARLRDTVRVTVEEPFVHPAPESLEFCPGEVLSLGVEALDGYSYEWIPVTGLQNPYLSATTVAPEAAIVYTLVITSDTMRSENCRTQEFPVVLTSDGCVSQNVVTPNGDGINDFLNLGTFKSPLSLTVYDRWGGVVYASSGYANDWPSGDSKLPETVYYYVGKVAGAGGMAFSGQVLVVR